ncbi:MAG: hypothetical protein JSR61_03675 [Proteobacteria bacterium]|nr:hypothetical protein [Pseudomonadota bacterium]
MTGQSSSPALFEMMQRLGIDPARRSIAQSELTYLTALHQCQGCKSKAECRSFLAQAPMSFAFAPAFCPNNDLLFEMQFDQGEPHVLHQGFDPGLPAA